MELGETRLQLEMGVLEEVLVLVVTNVQIIMLALVQQVAAVRQVLVVMAETEVGKETQVVMV